MIISSYFFILLIFHPQGYTSSIVPGGFQHFAVFQSKIHTHEINGDILNTTMLENDFASLKLANYFMKMFQKCAKHYDIHLPGMPFIKTENYIPVC